VAARSIYVGMAVWQRSDGISSGYAQQLRRRGHRTVTFLCHEPVPAEVEVVVVTGPFGSLVPLAHNLLAMPAAQRPALALIMTEQLPDPALPEAWRSTVGAVRSRLERVAHRHTSEGIWQLRTGWARLANRAHRYRYYGDLFWLRDAGLLSALAVWSHWTADFLRQRGFDPLVPSMSLNPAMGKDLGLERDIPVLWLGKVATARRRRMLANLRRELHGLGIPLQVVDGVEQPYVFGEARTQLLNRTRIMLNLLRAQWDDTSLRYVLAANNKAMLVSEPSLPHTAFTPGVHVIEAPAEKLAAVIHHYLQHEDERRAIAENAHRLLADGGERGAGLEQVVTMALEARCKA
jgi:hypothetical protein